MRISTVLAVVWLEAATACGGKLEGGFENSQNGAAGSENEADSTASSDEDDLWAPKPMGECQGGWDPGEQSEDNPCRWWADEECFDTKEDACACICPDETDSVCWSEWPTSDDTYTIVKCEAVES